MPDVAPTQPPKTPPHALPEGAAQAPAPQPQPAPQPSPHLTPHPDPQPDDDTAPDERLRIAVEDAQTLLDYAARHAIDIDHDIVAPLIASHDKTSQGHALSGDEKAQFWAAFAGIIERVKPVSVDSINFTAQRHDDESKGNWFSHFFNKSSPADRILRRYLTVAVFSLLALLGLQMEWAIGMAVFNDAYKVHGYLMNTTSKLAEAKLLSESLKDSATVAGADAAIKLEQLERRHAQDGSWDDVSYVRLWWWNRQIAGMIPPYDLHLSDEGPPIEAGLVKLDAEGQRRIEFTRAQLTLEVISNYVLVALFALLGSMTQALRSLSAEIDAVSLTANRLYAIRTRIILGVISGVCMAWLIIISSNDGGVEPTAQAAPLTSISFLGAFTPWAMAFISGYSVEIFFAALERAIAFFIRRIAAGPQIDPQATQKTASPKAAAPATQKPTQPGAPAPIAPTPQT